MKIYFPFAWLSLSYTELLIKNFFDFHQSLTKLNYWSLYLYVFRM